MGILQARILEWVFRPFSGDLPDPGTEPGSLALQAHSSPAELPQYRSLVNYQDSEQDKDPGGKKANDEGEQALFQAGKGRAKCRGGHTTWTYEYY